MAGTAVALTVPSGSTHALARVETAAIRYKRDGNDPTATDGILLMEFEAVELTSLSAVKLIRTTATSATVHLDYYAFE